MLSELPWLLSSCYMLLPIAILHGKDLDSLLPDGQSSGFLSNAVPSPRRYNFTHKFDINLDWSDVCFEQNATVSVM